MGLSRRRLAAFVASLSALSAGLSAAKHGKQKRRKHRRRKRYMRRAGKVLVKQCIRKTQLTSCYEAEIACCQHLQFNTWEGARRFEACMEECCTICFAV